MYHLHATHSFSIKIVMMVSSNEQTALSEQVFVHYNKLHFFLIKQNFQLSATECCSSAL